MSKYKPMYKVIIAGEVVGYVTDKNNVEKIIKEYIDNREGNIAFVDVKEKPEYEFCLTDWNKNDSTEAILQKIKDTSEVTYKLYAIKLNNESQQYVSTVEEAEQVVYELKEKFDGEIDLNIGIEEIYTSELENIESIDMQVAKVNLDTKILESSGSAIDGVILSAPISGTLTSRFGERWGRSHTGIDIGASTGTPIHACSKGKVTFAGWNSGYGYLVIVDHGNGVETYYAHCSKIYVSVGTEVTKDTVIAAVGSTGNSTGPHLHLEIRKDGVSLNPQNYLYK